MNKNEIKIDATRFNQMMRVLDKRTAASYEQVLKGMTKDIILAAIKRTGVSKATIVRKAIKESVATKFISKSGDKLRKARDGSMVFKMQGSNKWIKLRTNFDLKNISNKNPGSQAIGSGLRIRVNRAIQELKALQKKIIATKVARIESSRGSFILMLRKLRIPVSAARGLTKALKAEMTPGHKRSVGAKLLKKKLFASIVLSSRSRSALNPKARGIGAFRMALNGQIAQFKRMLNKDLKGYVKRFATRHGFDLR